MERRAQRREGWRRQDGDCECKDTHPSLLFREDSRSQRGRIRKFHEGNVVQAEYGYIQYNSQKEYGCVRKYAIDEWENHFDLRRLFSKRAKSNFYDFEIPTDLGSRLFPEQHASISLEVSICFP